MEVRDWLAISKQLTETMGGEIGVESEPGGGSTFWFTAALDTRPAIGSTSVEAATALLVRCPGLRLQQLQAYVLVAEDNLVNQEVTGAMLESLDCRVDVAANGHEAITALAHFPYDLVLMDCQMPEIDGFAATRAVRE